MNRNANSAGTDGFRRLNSGRFIMYTNENRVNCSNELPCFKKAGESQMIIYLLVKNVLNILKREERYRNISFKGSYLDERKEIYAYYDSRHQIIMDLLNNFSLSLTGNYNYLRNCLDDLNMWEREHID